MLLVGTVARPHGLRGEVVVVLATNRLERLDEGSVLTDRAGSTHTVARSRPLKNRFVVGFDTSTSIEEAESLRGRELYAAPLDDPDELWVHDLVGSVVEDVTGRVLGTVDAVEAN